MLEGQLLRRSGPVRVRIVAAGTAGLTLSALLRQWGVTPLVVDRAPDFAKGIEQSLTEPI
jgi:2-polyprenyl-6-methoxyphenol hydroxylase-like FAD-dependent oxidoreductase